MESTKRKEQSRKRYLLKREEILAKNKLWQLKNKDKVREAQKKWRIKNKDKYREQMRVFSKKWRAENPTRVKASRYSTRDKLRTDVLEAYGNKCVCCGENIRQFLAIDHINNDGASHKRSLGLKSAQAFYTWLRTNNYPKENFQILCHNCNMAKGFYGKCPHQN